MTHNQRIYGTLTKEQPCGLIEDSEFVGLTRLSVPSLPEHYSLNGRKEP
jgi:hypothetical protein